MLEINTQIIEDINNALAFYPALHLEITNDAIEIQGKWFVKNGEEIIEEYDILITIDKDYPNSVPKVFELSKKIPRDIDRHLVEADGWRACLFVPDQRWETWPLGAGFLQFLQISVHNFFLGQAYFDEFLEWPFGDRPHGEDGVISYYIEKFGTSNIHVLISLMQLVVEEKVIGSSLCPCGSKKKLCRCHGLTVKKLRENQDKILVSKALSVMCRHGLLDLQRRKMREWNRQFQI